MPTLTQRDRRETTFERLVQLPNGRLILRDQYEAFKRDFAFVVQGAEQEAA
jgi:hypothetical protein